MQLIVAHPDTQHSVHAARALRGAGRLRFLLTSLSLRRPALLGPLLEAVAPAARRKLAQHRGHPDFMPDELRLFTPHALLSRLGGRAWRLSQDAFGAWAGVLAIRERAGVLAFNTNAVRTFRLLNRAALPAVLDQTIAHRRWSDRVGQAECDAFPEYGDVWAAPGWRAELEDEEHERADLILCGSRFCADTLAQEGVPARKLAVAEYGADTAAFTPRSGPRPPGPLRLLFVGSVTLRKGVHYLLEAVRRVEKLGVTLTLAGGNALRPEALAPYRHLLAAPGFRLHDEMPALYAAHDLYVFPSLVEGSSLSIYEALASGLPVITTPNSGSLVRHEREGLLVPPRDVDALAAAIERLARDEALRAALARGARRRALEAGDWRHYRSRLVGALNPLLERWA